MYDSVVIIVTSGLLLSIDKTTVSRTAYFSRFKFAGVVVLVVRILYLTAGAH